MRFFRKNKPLLIIIFTVFIDLLGYGILIPVIPLLLADPASEFYLLPHNYSIFQGYILLGFLLAIYPFMMFLATPILGQLSDRFGRKKLLFISLAGTCISYLIFASGIIFKNLPLLFISRGFDGITGGNISVAQAAIADITPPEDRAKNFGLIGAAFGIGFIIGPFLGGKLSDPAVLPWFSATTPFFFAAILSFLNLISIFLLFPETHPERHYKPIHPAQSIKNIIRAFSLPKLRPLFSTSFLMTAGFTFFTTFFSVFLINKFRFTQGNIGDFFAYLGIWIAFTQAVITRKVSGIFKEYQVLQISLFGMALVVILYFLPQYSWQLLLIAPFFAVFNGLTQANLTGLISRSAGPNIQGEVLGLGSSVQALAQTVPPVLSGYLAAGLNPASPIFVSAIFLLLSGWIFLLFYNPKDHDSALSQETRKFWEG